MASRGPPGSHLDARNVIAEVEARKAEMGEIIRM
jgi:hypothetical protein